MRHYIMMMLAAVTAIVATSCNDRSRSALDNIADAEQALSYGRVDDALSIADALDGEIDGGNLTVTALGRLSLLHMRLNELNLQESNDNVEKAVRCYRAAVATDADSARMFYTECEVDDVPYSMTLLSIVKSIDEPMAWPEEEPDSIPM